MQHLILRFWGKMWWIVTFLKRVQFFASESPKFSFSERKILRIPKINVAKSIGMAPIAKINVAKCTIFRCFNRKIKCHIFFFPQKFLSLRYTLSITTQICLKSSIKMPFLGMYFFAKFATFCYRTFCL